MHPDPTYSRCKITRVPAEALAGLQIGIIVREPIGQASYRVNHRMEVRKEIGRITVADGGIEIWPYFSASTRELDTLRGIADKLWRKGPGRGWDRYPCPVRGEIRWAAVTVKFDGMPAGLIPSNKEFHEMQDAEFFMHFAMHAPGRHGTAA